MKTILIAAVVLIGGVAFADTDRSSAQLALDKGCFACHGEPPRKNSPTFDQLAKDFARCQGQPEQELKLADKLREGHIFGGIQAHENLSAENARSLIRWIIQGAR